MRAAKERASKHIFPDERTWEKYVRGFHGMFSVSPYVESESYVALNSSDSEYLTCLQSAEYNPRSVHWNPGTFELEFTNFTERLLPCWWGSTHRDITRMLEECAYHSRNGLLVSEESLHKILWMSLYPNRHGGSMVLLSSMFRFLPHAKISVRALGITLRIAYGQQSLLTSLTWWRSR